MPRGRPRQEARLRCSNVWQAFSNRVRGLRLTEVLQRLSFLKIINRHMLTIHFDLVSFTILSLKKWDYIRLLFTCQKHLKFPSFPLIFFQMCADYMTTKILEVSSLNMLRAGCTTSTFNKLHTLPFLFSPQDLLSVSQKKSKYQFQQFSSGHKS